MPRSTRDALVPILAMVLLAYGLHTAWFWWVCEDAWISLRYAHNLAEGEGLRFNRSTPVPVEGYSNFSWVLLAAALETVGITPVLGTNLMSAASGALLVVLTGHAMHHRFHLDPLATGGALLTMVLCAPFAVWATSGLATMPQALLMFATWYALSGAETTRDATLAGVLALLLALTRVEGIAWSVVIGIVVAATQPRSRAVLIRYAAVLVGGFLPYALWKAVYFQTLLAGPMGTKLHLGVPTVMRGLKYVLGILASHVTPLVGLAGVAVAATPRWRSLAGGPALLALGVTGYAVVVGGDYMPFFRFLVPGMAFLAICTGLVFEEVLEAGGRIRATALVTAAVTLTLLPSVAAHALPEQVREVFNVRANNQPDDLLRLVMELPAPEVSPDEENAWEAYQPDYHRWHRAEYLETRRVGEAEALRPHLSPGDVIVNHAVGAFAYALPEIDVWERNGLVTPGVHAEAEYDPTAAPGHDFRVNQRHFYDRRPSVLTFELFGEEQSIDKLEGWWSTFEGRDGDHAYEPELHRTPKGEFLVIARLSRTPESRAAAIAAWSAALRAQRPNRPLVH